jgi:hypothetical protein
MFLSARTPFTPSDVGFDYLTGFVTAPQAGFLTCALPQAAFPSGADFPFLKISDEQWHYRFSDFRFLTTKAQSFLFLPYLFLFVSWCLRGS